MNTLNVHEKLKYSVSSKILTFVILEIDMDQILTNAWAAMIFEDTFVVTVMTKINILPANGHTFVILQHQTSKLKSPRLITIDLRELQTQTR